MFVAACGVSLAASEGDSSLQCTEELLVPWLLVEENRLQGEWAQ